MGNGGEGRGREEGEVKGREGDWCPPHDLFARRPCDKLLPFCRAKFSAVGCGTLFRLCSRWWCTFDAWDVSVGGVGQAVGVVTLRESTPPSYTSLGYV